MEEGDAEKEDAEVEDAENEAAEAGNEEEEDAVDDLASHLVSARRIKGEEDGLEPKIISCPRRIVSTMGGGCCGAPWSGRKRRLRICGKKKNVPNREKAQPRWQEELSNQ